MKQVPSVIIKDENYHPKISMKRNKWINASEKFVNQHNSWNINLIYSTGKYLYAFNISWNFTGVVLCNHKVALTSLKVTKAWMNVVNSLCVKETRPTKA